jgi:hydroxymethylbilane synthase
MLEREGAEVETVVVRTSGDESARKPARGSDPFAAPGDKSRFVKEIEEALLAGDADLAVHSAKDVPGALPDGLALVGVPERADARDALCGAASLDALAPGARVGTSSLRRRAQLLALRPDLEVAGLRGNVDTRLRKLADGDYDAVVLAAAGLARLGRSGDGAVLPAAELTPAPGQGCLALEARADHAEAVELAARLTDRAALVRLTAERALVSALDATCRTPVAAHAELADGVLRLAAFAGLPDGSTWIRDELDGDAADPAALGAAVADRLLAAGAAEVLAQAEAAAASL